MIDPQVVLEIAAGMLQPATGRGLLAPLSLRLAVLERRYRAVRQGTQSDDTALALHARFGRLKLRDLDNAVPRRRAWALAMPMDLEATGPAK